VGHPRQNRPPQRRSGAFVYPPDLLAVLRLRELKHPSKLTPLINPNMQIFLSEFFGTMLLIIFGDGVVANVVLGKTKGQNSGWIVIATGWAMAVVVGVYASWGYSGAHINPAVTIALWSVGLVKTELVPIYLIAQFAGAFVGGIIVWLAYHEHFKETESQALKLATFCTGPALRTPGWNLLTEIIGTFTLLFGVLSMLGPNLKPTTGLGAALGPFIVGMLVWAIGLSLGGPTGYAVNPARDLGPRISHALLPIPGKGSSDWGYSWIPVVGPIIGGILGAVVWKITLGTLPSPAFP
jgi:glycerol uptake facilitator protein